jgi:transcriptional regulator with XRE-family HTH domain
MNLVDERRDNHRQTSPIERHVGDRLRLARRALSLSQEALAEQLGVTFQQVQKYEKGINRISAGRLHHVAEILDVPVSYFFPESDASALTEARRQSLPESVVECLDTREGMDLVLTFSRIADPRVRRQVLQLVRSLAQKSAE